MLDLFIEFFVMRAIDFGIFDITVALVSRKQEDRFWFHRIWSCNEESKAKEVKERKERKKRKSGASGTAGRVLEGRWLAVG